jgi:hypothetical protein
MPGFLRLVHTASLLPFFLSIFYPLLTLSLPINFIGLRLSEEFVTHAICQGHLLQLLPAYNAVSTSTSFSSAQSFRSCASSGSAITTDCLMCIRACLVVSIRHASHLPLDHQLT